MPQDTFQSFAQGAMIPFIQNNGKNMNLPLYGTNFSPQLTIAEGNAPFGYNIAMIMQPLVEAYDPNFQHFKLMMYYYAKKLSAAKNANILGLYYKNHGTDNFEIKTSNPNIMTSTFKAAIEGAHLHYSDGTLITDAAQLWMEIFIMNHHLRNNEAIPPKYRNNFIFNWYRSTHSPSNYYINTSFFDSPASLNMASWDMSQTNEDTDSVKNSVIPWWPKVIDPPGPNVYGQLLNPNDPSGNMTQETTYRGICESSAPYVSEITRHLWSLGGFSYALTSNITSVTVELTEPTDTSGTYGDYNTNVAVAVFKYIPECCVTGVRSDKGAFLMKGPYTLSGTGDSKTINLSGAFVNDLSNSFIVSKTGTSLTAPMMNFNYVFPHGVDGADTIYNPPSWSLARGHSLGMSGNDVYQPVTYIAVINKQIDDFEFDDSDVTQKLYLEQLKPSSVKVSVVSY